VFNRLSDLRQHKHQDSRTCGVCGKACTRTNNFYKHFRKDHPQLLDAQGGCAPHGVPPRAVRRTLPEDPWKVRLDAVDARHDLAPGTTWLELTKGGGYSELMCTVRDCAKGDTRKRKLTAAQRAYATRLKTDPARRHALAQQILDYVIERELLWPRATDDLGGFVATGLKVRPHAGLWGLSLDRRDNGEPHFAVPCEASEPRLVEGYGGSGSVRGSQAMVSAYHAAPPPTIGPGTNLRAVAAGMNTQSNPGDHWDGATCARLRAELARPVSSSMVQSAIAAEATSRDGRTLNVLYNSTKNAFQDPKAKAAFGTVAAMFAYTKELLSNQGARCAVSGILLRGPSGPVEERVFRMSVDAIEPLKGHVCGNLRLICQFLQAGACDKNKKTVDTDDGPSQWTPALFREYVGVNARGESYVFFRPALRPCAQSRARTQSRAPARRARKRDHGPPPDRGRPRRPHDNTPGQRHPAHAAHGRRHRLRGHGHLLVQRERHVRQAARTPDRHARLRGRGGRGL
jgi:hypothetical protein